MSDTKLLQTLIDGQKEIKDDIKRVEKKVDGNGERIDKLGLSLADLADDAPTRAEFDDLQDRVDKLEERTVAA